MGVVYEAVQTLMDRRVAIKVINPSILAHPTALPRFQAEVKAAAKLDHPNIVRAYDADQVGDLHLLVMEYVDGISLAARVGEKGPLPVVHACHYIRQAALGLEHAFERGMVHRDIKPGNLMRTPSGQVKILDFGLARLRETEAESRGLTASGAFMGTPEYVAPEQAQDARKADIRSDIYSLGCTLYYLLTGRPPFEEETAVQMIIAHIERQPPPLDKLRPDVPKELATVLANMLEKKPSKRYQTPSDVAKALLPFTKPQADRAVDAAIEKQPARTEKLGKRDAAAKGRRPASGKLPSFGQVNNKRRWYIRSAIAAGVLLLGMLVVWASGILKVKTKNGTIVHEHVQAGAVKSGEAKPSQGGGPVPAGAARLARPLPVGTWRIRGDELVQEDPNAARPAAVGFGDVSWTDLDFTTQAMALGDKTFFEIGFRATDLDNWWNFTCGSDNLRIQLKINGQASEEHRRQETVRPNQWHEVRVRARAAHIECWLDGKPQFQFDDGRHPRGCVFVATYRGAGRFRDIKVTAPDGELLWKGLPDLPASASNGLATPAADARR
jgi:hypothetical protein